MLRAILGEAGIDSRGLWIDDRQQGWTLRVGNIRHEMLRDAAEWTDGQRRRLPVRTDPLWGAHFSRKF